MPSRRAWCATMSARESAARQSKVGELVSKDRTREKRVGVPEQRGITDIRRLMNVNVDIAMNNVAATPVKVVPKKL